MLLRIVLIILFSLVSFLFADSNTISIPGKNLIWSQASNVFIYSILGKTSGAQIWHLFDPEEEGEIDTLFHGQNTTPVWSFDGKYIAYQSATNIIIIDADKNTTSFPSQVSAVDTIYWSPDSLKLMYSGDNKIFMYDFTVHGGAFITYGRKPLLLQQNKGLICSDDDFNLYYLNQNMEKNLLLTDIDDFRLSHDGNMVMAWNGKDKRFIRMDLTTKSTSDFQITGNIAGFDLSPDGSYIIYSMEGKGVIIKNLKSGSESMLFPEGIYPRFSFDETWLSYEMPKSDSKVLRTEDVKNKFPVAVYIKISLGKKDGLKPGDMIKVYEEKLNPFTKQVIGYDPDRYKTTLKVVNVFDSFALTQDTASVSVVEVNDAVVIPDRNMLGAVTGIEK